MKSSDYKSSLFVIKIHKESTKLLN